MSGYTKKTRVLYAWLNAKSQTFGKKPLYRVPKLGKGWPSATVNGGTPRQALPSATVQLSTKCMFKFGIILNVFPTYL